MAAKVPTVVSATGRVSAEERTITMRNYLAYIDRDGKKRVNWTALTAFAVFIYAATIAFAEVFWFGFTGGFSTLIGLYAVVAATLVVVRVVGGVLMLPADLLRAQSGGV